MTMPHIFLLTVDTLRADHLSCYREDGYISTIHLDRLAEDGQLYLNAMSCANHTVPSYAALLTGRYPSSLAMKVTSRLDDAVPTLPLLLKPLGYHAACWTVASAVGKDNGLARDFQEYELVPSNKFMPSWATLLLKKTWGRMPPSTTRISGVKGLEDVLWRGSTLHRYWLAMHDGLGPSGGVAIVEGLKHLCDTASGPLLVLANFFEPHSPYYPPKPHWQKELTAREYLRVIKFNLGHWNNVIRSKDLRDEDRSILLRLYKSEVTYVDELIGSFIHYLKQRGLYEDALIVLIADHGESLGDHNLLGHWHALYEDLVHVPLIIKWPAGLRRGRVKTLVQNVDILPTILTYLGVDVPPAAEGLSLLDPIPDDRVGIAEQIDNPADVYRTRSAFDRWQRAMSEFNYTTVALRQGNYKYVAYSSGARELFDLARTPDETWSVVDEDRERASYFERLLTEMGRDNILSAYSHAEDERITTHLEQLGYI